MTAKPERIFDREREWAGLDAFARNPYRGAMLGVVSGRQRQGISVNRPLQNWDDAISL